MILVDKRQGIKKDGSNSHLDLIPYIKKRGVPVEEADLEYGDAAFEGKGPDGNIMVGVERKRLHDMLHCIDDAHYSARQKVGMRYMYAVSILMIEGYWRPHSDNDLLMEGYDKGLSWGYCKYRSQRVMYAKLRRYLMSVALSGVIVCETKDPFDTAYNIVEWFHYFGKKWDDHTSLLETMKLNIPSLSGKPSLTRRWACDLEGIGVKHSIEAERMFKTPIALATADEMRWMSIDGVGAKTAQSIVKEIQGVRR